MSPEYATRFKTAAVSIDDLGVLTIRLHSRGGPLGWNGLPHRELPELFANVAADRNVRAVILTGTGDRFIDLIPSFEEGVARGEATAAMMDEGLFEGNRLMSALLGIEVPIIAAVNGPVDVHAELALLSDIVLCTRDTYFQDAAHVPLGLVPGDGVQVVWPMLLGINRARYFLLTGQKIAAAEALQLGVVSEVVAAEALTDRAVAHARRLAVCNPVFVRNTRLVFIHQLRRAMAADLSAGLALEAVASLSGANWDGPSAPEPIDTIATT
ncbi:enoyl-CoA hydratase/isomerase family protein [Nocardia sp. NBC_00565]|uniref:enoyl-CoA hydratase/isomerase family protein n=1 Tax=Nocardia sp. NBC_00565 TaxID=2975993 RepID=UPI002E81D377|nr:enoyl-CoA hydratase/isomerase family protein [Nocardia sp. NBC_00565]WUC06760.1 enoyl-CoA hydratase/isomerase family protein [Nocardia sp. NBC_00565]